MESIGESCRESTGRWFHDGAIGGIVVMAGDGRGEAVRDGMRDVGEAIGEDGNPGWIPWIRAEADEGWREKRKRNPKRMGELSQAAFLLKAQSLGFGLAVPWGDSEKCDFIVWAGRGGRLLRVQVKATGRLYGGGYDVQPVYSTRHEGKKTYTAEQIDVLAAHVVLREHGKDVWYLLPIAAFAGEKTLRFFPDLRGRRPRWEKYREAWEWLEDGQG